MRPATHCSGASTAVQDTLDCFVDRFKLLARVHVAADC